MSQNLDNQQWLIKQLPMLDAPEVLTHELNSYVRDWTDPKFMSVPKFCFIAPTPYEMCIANMGIAILYDQINSSEKAVIERWYYPEDKLNRRLKKDKKKFFSKETCHNLNEFDVLGISSYFPQQMLIVPEILDRSGIPILTNDRNDSHPLVMFGGCTAFAAEPVWDMVDMMFVGQGEEQLPKILDLVKQLKVDGQPNWKLRLKEAICDWPGCYIPEFYKVDYYPKDHDKKPRQIKAITPVYDKAPAQIIKASIDLQAYPPLTRTIITNAEGLEMAAGALMVAIGCGSRCFFCHGSFTTAPYRERTEEQVMDGFKDICFQCGAPKLVPFAFNHSDFSSINRVVRRIQLEQRRTISFSSQRIDKWTKEPYFADIAILSGHRSITFAIEGGSQRLRNIINKNLRKSDIINAFSLAFRKGYTNIKVYMISNIPHEKEEDRFEIVALMKEILALKDSVYNDMCKEAESANRPRPKPIKTKIRLSYTPFQAKDHTPFQWAPIYHVFTQEDVGRERVIKTSPKGVVTAKVTQEEVGLPEINRNLNPVMDKLQELKLRVRSSAELESAVINQALCMGDRRMSRVIREAYSTGLFTYHGGMTVGRGVLQGLGVLLNKVGLSYSYLFREKDEDEVFPWDHISAGITKAWLLDGWRLSKWQAAKDKDGETFSSGEPFKNPFDKYYQTPESSVNRVFGGVTSCWDGCTHCGCCEDKRVARITRPHHEDDDKAENVAKQLYLAKCGTKGSRASRSWLVQFSVFNDYRWVHNSKKAMHLRRAFIRSGVPVEKNIQILSDGILEQAWFSGIDYAQVMVTADITKDQKAKPDDRDSYEEFIGKLNDNLQILRVLSVQEWNTDKKELRTSVDTAAFRIIVPLSLVPEYKESLAKFEVASEFTVSQKILGSGRDQLELVQHDVKKDRICCVVPVENGDKLSLFFLLHRDLSPHNFLSALFDTHKRRFVVYGAHRWEYVRPSEGGVFGQKCTHDGCRTFVDMRLAEKDTYLDNSTDDVGDPKCFKHMNFSDLINSANMTSAFQLFESGKQFISPV